MNDSQHSISLVGTAGWERAGWSADYYPEDLPPDWRLAYYANDCGCVLLDAPDLERARPGDFCEAIEEVGGQLAILVRVEGDGAGLDADWLACFAGLHAQVTVLAPPGVTLDRRLRHWPQAGEGLWREPGGDRWIVCWHIDDFDLRQLKARVPELPGRVFALVTDGRGASPARVGELRTLLALMGRA
jgi:hypothetical protein